MISGLWGKKIGMTQLFVQDKVVPVTAIDVSQWIITNIRTQERDGYSAIQVGCLRDKYYSRVFSKEWLSNLKKYFIFIREIKVDAAPESFVIGQPAHFLTQLHEGALVDVVGITKGRGYAGTIKRHDFGGAAKTHGSKMGRRPGSLSCWRSQGRVAKGKKLSGHMGTDQRRMKNLQVVKVFADTHVVLVKGSVPGHSGSLVFVRKI